jgi:septum site-determining protein MinD
MSKVIGVFSNKGGVGKTTTAINLASALNEFGRIVVLVDTDITSPNLGMYLGTHNNPISLNHVIKGEANIYDAAYLHESGIFIVIGSINPGHSIVDYNKINEQLQKLKEKFEMIVVDSAPGQDKESLQALSAVDSMVIVTTPELAAVTDALRTITIGKQIGKNVVGAVVTRAHSHDYEMSRENIEAMLGVPVLAVIPEDKNVPLSARVKSPIVRSNPDADAAVAYKKLAAILLGSKYERYENRSTTIGNVLRGMSMK